MSFYRLLVVGTFAIFLLPLAQSAQTPVNVPDDTLRKELLFQIAQFEQGDFPVVDYDADITKEDLQAVFAVEPKYQGGGFFRADRFRGPIYDLTGLEEIEVLRYFESYPGSVLATDLSPLAGNPNLEVIRLPDAPVEDLSPLATLSKLNWLVLDNSRVSDLSPLSGTNLTNLYLAGGSLNDLSPLSNLPLSTLRLIKTGLEDISPLSSLPVRILILSDNSISDVSALASMTAIESLDLSNNNISDISALSSLVTLKELNISNNPITDISALRGLPNLTHLDISSTDVSDLGPLKDMQSLDVLHAESIGISDVTALSESSAKYFFLSGNKITDVSHFGYLLALDISDNPIDLSPGSEQYMYLDNIVSYGRRARVYVERWAHFRGALQDQGWVLADQLLGWIYPDKNSDWILLSSFARWIYAPEEMVTPRGIRAYFPAEGAPQGTDPEGLWGIYPIGDGGNVNTGTFLDWIVVIDKSSWIYSWTFHRWIYISEELVSTTGGWVYLPYRI